MRKIILALAGAAVLVFFAGCTAGIHIKHPTGDVMVTTGNGGKPYKTLGVIMIRKDTLGFATSGLDFVTLGGNGGFSDESESMVGDMEKYLNEALVKTAKEKGGNAVINVKYSHSRGAILIPWVGPLGIVSYGAVGEVVQLQ